MMGQICHHFSWTLDYLLEKPDWYVVQRMLIDAPRLEEDTPKKQTTHTTTFTEETASELLANFNDTIDE